MRFSGCSLRCLLPVLLTLLAAPQIVGQNANIDELMKQAAQGIVRAQYNLGLAYYLGKGISKNDAEAARWFRKAAEQGLTEAQFNLGVMYDYGRGVSKNAVEAVRWYRKAAEKGDVDAQNNLGLAYRNGEGVPRDLAYAYFWLNLGASSNEEARLARDEVGERLTPAKRLEIQERCRKWAETHPPNHN